MSSNYPQNHPKGEERAEKREKREDKREERASLGRLGAISFDFGVPPGGSGGDHGNCNKTGNP